MTPRLVVRIFITLLFVICVILAWSVKLVFGQPVLKPLDGPSLQVALQSAPPGSTILLEPGVVYVGPFAFPARPSGSAATTIRVNGLLPARRIGPADASLLPTLTTSSPVPTVSLTNTAGWRLQGLNIAPSPNAAGETVVVENGVDIDLDQILIIVTATQKRGIRLNGRDLSVTRSHVEGVRANRQDSQAIATWNGAGPYLIQDNALEAASENYLVGGADSASAADLPCDITFEKNYVFKRLAWQGVAGFNVKNLLEVKAGCRIAIRDNVFENNWVDAQAGRAILFTPRNQGGAAPWTAITDLIFERNVIKNSPRGFSVTGYDDLAPSGQTTRITIRENTISTAAQAFLVANEIGEISIYRNTMTLPSGQVLLSLDRTTIFPVSGKRQARVAAEKLVFAENDAPGTWIHSPTVNGPGAFAAYTDTYSLAAPAPIPPPDPNARIDALEKRLDTLQQTLIALLKALTGGL